MCLWIDRKGGKYLLNHFVRVCECVLGREGDAERKSSPEGRVRYTEGTDCLKEDLNICRRLLIRTIKADGAIGGKYRAIVRTPIHM